MDERRKTAYHEAGHAVVGFYRGLPMEGADIMPTEERGGVVKFGAPPKGWDVGAYGEPLTAWFLARSQ